MKTINAGVILKNPRPKAADASKTLLHRIRVNYDLYLFILLPMLYILIFHYYPMYGVQIAFKDFAASKGIWGSPWVGFEHFKRFFDSYYFWNLIKNTLGISLYSLVVGFPMPIILALMLNEVKNQMFKKTVQMITYAPHFISTVVIAGMIIIFCSPSSGIINRITSVFGYEPVAFMEKAEWFKSIYVFSGVWQTTGWNTIIYIAALSGIDPGQYEAAKIDGASRFQRLWHVSLPGIMQTITICLILNSGSIMSVGFEKAFLLQNHLNLDSSEIISTYVYKVGLTQAQYGFSAAVGLFNSVINFILLIIVNSVSRRLSDTSLF